MKDIFLKHTFGAVGKAHGYIIFKDGSIFWIPKGYFIDLTVRESGTGKVTGGLYKLKDYIHDQLFTFTSIDAFHQKHLMKIRRGTYNDAPGGTSLLYRFRSIETFTKRFSADAVKNKIFTETELKKIQEHYRKFFPIKAVNETRHAKVKPFKQHIFETVGIKAYYKRPKVGSGVIVFNDGSCYYLPPKLVLVSNFTRVKTHISLRELTCIDGFSEYVNQVPFRDRESFEEIYREKVMKLDLMGELKWRADRKVKGVVKSYPASRKQMFNYPNLKSLISDLKRLHGKDDLIHDDVLEELMQHCNS